MTCIVSFLQYNKVSFKFLSYRGYSMKLLKSEIVLGKIILEIWFSRPTCLESFTNLISEGKGKSISISDKVEISLWFIILSGLQCLKKHN